MDTRIYVMTHKSYTQPSDEGYITLHVGREGKQDLGYAGDNTGDHISAKNPNYCELTGLYWLWKNVRCDIVGVCHYRRFFMKNGHILGKDDIERILQDYDMIVPDSACTTYADNRTQYADKHILEDLLLCGEVIGEKYPQYRQAFEFLLSSNLFSVGNMVITRKEIFDAYCAWLFDILFTVEQRLDISGYDTYQARVMGFLSERLFRVWLMGNHFKIREEAVKLLEFEELDKSRRLVALKSKYVSMLLQDVIARYMQPSRNTSGEGRAFARYMQPSRNTSGEGRAFARYPQPDSVHSTVDRFDGKLPVWVCWWDGIEHAPEAIRLCYHSMCRNMPQDRTKVCLVTFDNYAQYLDFPAAVVQKFNDGKIPLAHLSEILCMGLLARYGGLWVDADCIMLRALPDTVLQAEFYTRKGEGGFSDTDLPGVVRGRWDTALLKGEKDNPLFSFAYEALCRYWELQDEMVDIHLLDYILAAAADSASSVRAVLEQCPAAEPGFAELIGKLDERYREENFNRLLSHTTFARLPSDNEYPKTVVTGEESVYGHLLEQYM